MSNSFNYHEYVSDQQFLSDYNVYQAKYAQSIRESDKRIIEILLQDLKGGESIIDIGCSTGNLLKHLRRVLPQGVALTGGDLAESSLAEARANPDLAGVSFETMDIMKLPTGSYYVIVVNAVLYMMTETQHDAALVSLFGALKQGGKLIVFDFAHPYTQELEIIETSESHPQGLRLCFRSQMRLTMAYQTAGFSGLEFKPFELPIDLPKQPYPNDLITFTHKDEQGVRMAFRGTLFQPWCHLVARKA